jgi:tripartite ATP-independent transporter DctP family solute receptor
MEGFMKQRVFSKVLLATSICFGIGGAIHANGSVAAEVGVKPKVLNFSHVFQTNHPVHIALTAANEALKQRTNGRLSLQIYPNSTYATYNDAVAAVRMGTLDMTCLDSASDWLKKSGVVLGPYVFRSYDHWANFKKSPIYNNLRDEIGKAMGVVQLDMYQFGFRHLTGNKIYRTLDDFKGTVLRVVDFPPYSELKTIFNASVTATPIGEVYMALKSGLVDAEENPVTQITTMKFYEVQKYLELTAHMLAVSSSIISQKTWNSLSPEDQKIMREVFHDEAAQIDKMVVENEEKLIQLCIDNGMTVIRDVDTKPFRDRVPLVLKNYPEWVELYNEIQKIDG